MQQPTNSIKLAIVMIYCTDKQKSACPSGQGVQTHLFRVDQRFVFSFGVQKAITRRGPQRQSRQITCES